tara:strand:+ start:504 stop:839 length:336 start_codon:yes stop_codon:yes gene_type:complete
MRLKPIKDKKKIEKIFEMGSLVKYGSVAVKFYDFNNHPSEYGVSVPKKTFPLAVTRNKIKRQVRHCVDDLSKKSSIKNGRSFFIIIHNQKTPLYKKIYTDLSLALEKLTLD